MSLYGCLYQELQSRTRKDKIGKNQISFFGTPHLLDHKAFGVGIDQSTGRIFQWNNPDLVPLFVEVGLVFVVDELAFHLV